MFGNTKTHNPFTANTTINTPMSSFGNTSNSTQNPFGTNTSGNASVSSFGSKGLFGTNTSGNASVSSFGSKGLFGTNTSGNASMPVFGNTGHSNPNPFGNGVGNTSNSNPNSFGNGKTLIFGNTNNNPFGNGKTSVFGNTNNPNPNPFGNRSTSIFGNKNSLDPNPFGRNTFGNTSGISFNGTSTGIFGNAAATAGTSGLFGGLTNNGIKNPFGIIPGGTASASPSASTGSGITFGQPSNSLFGPQGAVTSTPFPSSSNLSSSFGQNKGSKIHPYKPTKDNSEGVHSTFVSISAMPSYGSKCHEELRFEDYELKSTGTTLGFPNSLSTVSAGSSAGLFPPQNPVFAPFPNIRTSTSPQNSLFPNPAPPFPSSHNPFLPTPTPTPTPTPSFKLTPSSTTPSFNLTPSSTTPSFLNITPPSTPTPAFTPSLFPSLSPSFPKIPPPSNSTSSVLPSATTTPPIIQPFNQNTLTVNPTPSVSSITWPSFTKPVTMMSPVLENQPPSKPSADCIVAVKDPFGSQSATSHHSIGHQICYGISSMPVIDKPVTERVSSSLVSSRHISSRPLTVRARKYNPKSDEPKVAFFVNTDETRNTQKAYASVAPRINPRSMFRTDASTLLHEDGKLGSFDDTSGGNVKKDQATSCSPIDVDCKKPVPKNCIKVNPSLPKLHRSDYYTQPSIDMLRSAETSEPGFCSNVKDFVIGRHGYGWIKFKGETNIRGLDLDVL